MNKENLLKINNHLYFVTIIMPIRNEKDFIGQSLRAVLDQDYPSKRLEIILIDGMSDDGTLEKLESYQDRYSNINVIDNPRKIVSTGLNKALQIAKGKIIIRVDGHCIIAQNYVSKCVQYLQNKNISGVGGCIETIGETNTAKLIACAMSSFFGVGGSAFRTTQNKTMEVDTIPFPAYKKEVLEHAGSYDEELVRNQDDEYNYRLRKLGYKLLLAEDIKSKYYSRGSLKSLWSQYFQYGFWKVRVFQKHPKQMKCRQFIPFLFVVGVMSLSFLSFISVKFFYLLLCVVLAYVILDIMASLKTTVNHKKSNFLKMLLIFPILHFSYGFGFLFGFLKFINRWSHYD